MNNLVRIAVLSDTHAGKVNELPLALVDALIGMDMVVHLGDYSSGGLVNELKKTGKFRGVRGNHDLGDIHTMLPKKDGVEVNGRRIGLLHGHGCSFPRGLHKGLIAQFKEEKMDVILFGHTHIASSKVVEDVLLFNPGSAAGRFPARNRTYGILTIGETVNADIVNIAGGHHWAHNASIPEPIRYLVHRMAYDWGILIKNI
jgi:hypothetical protein